MKEEEWLGWQDSNLRMAIPKTAALPLGYTPTVAVSITGLRWACKQSIKKKHERVGLILLQC